MPFHPRAGILLAAAIATSACTTTTTPYGVQIRVDPMAQLRQTGRPSIQANYAVQSRPLQAVPRGLQADAPQVRPSPGASAAEAAQALRQEFATRFADLDDTKHGLRQSESLLLDLHRNREILLIGEARRLASQVEVRRRQQFSALRPIFERDLAQVAPGFRPVERVQAVYRSWTPLPQDREAGASGTALAEGYAEAAAQRSLRLVVESVEFVDNSPPPHIGPTEHDLGRTYVASLMTVGDEVARSFAFPPIGRAGADFGQIVSHFMGLRDLSISRFEKLGCRRDRERDAWLCTFQVRGNHPSIPGNIQEGLWIVTRTGLRFAGAT